MYQLTCKKLLIVSLIAFSSNIVAVNFWEYVEQLLPDEPVLLEAGAHNGSDTVAMAKRFKNGQIFAFEPVPYLYNQVIEKTWNFPNVHCYQLALNDQCGTAEFYVSSGLSDGAGSLLTPSSLLLNDTRLHFDQVIQVKTITLDEWAKNEGITNIDFMWLDLQGSEPDVLMASPIIFQTVKVVFTEVNYKPLYQGAILYPEFKDWMISQGFSAILEAGAGYPGQKNILFVRR